MIRVFCWRYFSERVIITSNPLVLNDKSVRSSHLFRAFSSEKLSSPNLKHFSVSCNIFTYSRIDLYDNGDKRWTVDEFWSRYEFVWLKREFVIRFSFPEYIECVIFLKCEENEILDLSGFTQLERCLDTCCSRGCNPKYFTVKLLFS